MIKRLRAPLVVAATWFLLDRLFTVLAGHEGLLAPFGPVHVAPLLLGFVVLALRLVVTFAFLPWAVWRVTGR